MPLLSNDSASPEEMQRRQDATQEHLTNLNQAVSADDESMNAAYIDKMTNSRLDQGTIDMLSNLLSKDFLLANFSDAEVHEFRWLARVIRLEVEALHPHEDSVWQGEFRQVAFDDDYQNLKPLDDAELSIIEQFIMGVVARATRGKGGWQQEMFNKTFNVSERIDHSDDQEGGWLL